MQSDTQKMSQKARDSRESGSHRAISDAGASWEILAQRILERWRRLTAGNRRTLEALANSRFATLNPGLNTALFECYAK